MLMFDKLFKRDLSKRQKEEPYPCPYENCDTVIINKEVEHQNIGGKKAYIDRYITLDDITDRILELNAAAVNFVMRRPDLFKVTDKDIIYIATDPYNHKNKPQLFKRKAVKKDMKYYYVKIWQVDGPFGAEGCYLGYIIASDECSEPKRPIAYKIWPKKKGE